MTKNPIWILMIILVVSGAACTKKDAGQSQQAQSNIPPVITSPGGSGEQKVKIEDVKVGTGAEAVAGKVVSVHYTGTLEGGKEFDSSLKRGPFEFPLGQGQVIRGWDEGVVGMKVGGKRKLMIPPEMGYGARGAGGVIPPNATLYFDIELLGVKDGR